ncbi:MAG: hypothetical protein O2950_03080 [Proteobacteria bacterium]|nr:hypothetical protein [Pseudomonadota bacterium]MDA1351255.1 hypothetical protein [Pseudomonadota bacterium]
MHVKKAEKADCSNMDHSKMDMKDSVTMAMMKKCMTQAQTDKEELDMDHSKMDMGHDNMKMDHSKMDMDHGKMDMDHDNMKMDHSKIDMDHGKIDMDHGKMNHSKMEDKAKESTKEAAADDHD